jgi:adenine-specific DNA-methyltransferase
MSSKQRLELTWIGKENRPRLEPRILLEDPEKSYHAKKRVTDNDIFDNRLIFGDNLLALKALEQEFAGKVKCVFIDPPYNTGSAFEHYDDGVEHSIWLSLIRDRLELLHRLLSREGSLWITIDDNEAHYLKVLCDEVFGRSNFIANVVWQKRTSRENRAAIGSSHDHILIYAKMPAPEWKAFRNKLPANDAGFSNPDNDPRGPWRSIPFSAQGFRENQMYKILTPTGKRLDPPKGRCWGATEPEYKRYSAEGRVYFPKGGEGRPRIKLYRGEEEGLVPTTWWSAADCGDTEESKKEILALYPEQEPFGTPKPERLLKQIITIATNEGEIVLDSFAGSGTTGAVAQKMKRRWIMVELGEHAYTHIVPRCANEGSNH